MKSVNSSGVYASLCHMPRVRDRRRGKCIRQRRLQDSFCVIMPSTGRLIDSSVSRDASSALHIGLRESIASDLELSLENCTHIAPTFVSNSPNERRQIPQREFIVREIWYKI